MQSRRTIVSVYAVTLITVILAGVFGVIFGWYLMAAYNALASLDAGAAAGIGFAGAIGILWFFTIFVLAIYARFGLMAAVESGLNIGLIGAFWAFIGYFFGTFFGAVLARFFSSFFYIPPV